MSGSAPADDSAFGLEPVEGGFRVLSPDGYTVLECRDRHSADHYLELLNRAYRIGYKAGYRKGRKG